MSTYRKLHGRAIQAVTTDPSESVAEGQVWYNTTSDTFKSVVAIEAFSSASPLATTREGGGAFGTQTTAVICGGETPSVSGATEEYNGTGFSAGGTMNTARYRLQGTAGTSTAGIVFGGVEPSVSNKTETYNGTAWTTSPYTLNTARWCAGAGTQTSALAFGGGPSYKNNTEEFDGEGWTAVNTLNTSRNSLSGAGANAEDCLAFGGETSSPPAVATNATESWNGSSWTAVNNLNTARYGGYGAGTKSAAILIGGLVGPSTLQSATETWDGTNWTTSPASLATARSRLSVAGSSTAAIAMAGQTPSITTAAEEYNKSTNVITAAAWASGTALPISPGEQGTGMGQTAEAYLHGGYYSNPTSTNSAKYFIYDGSTHSATPNANNSYGWRGSNGSSTSGLVYGGYTQPSGSGPFTNSESFNGSSWSNETAIPIAEYGYVGAGPSETAAIVIGGDEGPTTTHLYNGSSWTSGGAYPFGGYQQAMAGTQTAAIASCGIPPSGSPGMKIDAYEYNGSSWTATGSSLEKLATHAIRGTQTAALAFGGVTLPISTGASFSQNYDGSVFSTNANIATARRVFANAGGTASSVVTSGGTTAAGSSSTATEEFTPGTTAVNITDFTTS